jgi:DNA repair ATPase RecN
VEFNKDYHGRRIDGFQCVTKKDLYGIIDRTYQKEEDVIRRERKVTQPMSINRFESEIRKGIEEIGRSQERFELHREVEKTSEALKFTNSRLLGLENLAEAMYKVLSKGGVEPHKLEDLEVTVGKFEAAAKTLAVSADKINEALSKLGDVEGDPKKLAEGQKKLGEYLV